MEKRFIIHGNAMVIRSKESAYKVFGDKISDLPWGAQGAARWFDRPDESLEGKTPRQVIDEGNAHLVEPLVDELEFLNSVTTALTQLRQQYGGLPQLQEVWNAIDRVELPWNKEN